MMVEKTKEEIQQIAEDHWDWFEKWLEMMFKDAFLHGYKHGKQDTEE